MARRKIGRATVTLFYSEEHDREGRWGYVGRITVPGVKAWPFVVRSGVGGVEVNGKRVAADSTEAYDAMARTAVSFGASWSVDNLNDPTEEQAYAIEEATAGSLADDGYVISGRG